MKKIKPVLKKLTSVKILLPLIILIAILAIVAGAYFFNQYQKAQKLLQNPSVVNTEESLDLLKKVSRLIDLPKESPTIATVSDINKLKNQDFFKNAKNGDKVIVFTNAKKAIIYRPSEDKIIEVSNINIPTPTGQNPTGTPNESKAKVALLNGTSTVGLTRTVESQLLSKFKNIDVTVKENASKASYEETIVVDLKGNKSVADSLAKELNGKVQELPEGESKIEDVDVLVILGSK